VDNSLDNKGDNYSRYICSYKNLATRKDKDTYKNLATRKEKEDLLSFIMLEKQRDYFPNLPDRYLDRQNT